MRLIVSVILSLGIAAFFAITAQASDLVGGMAKVLTQSEINPASQEKIRVLCDNQGYITIPNKKGCLRIVNESPLSQLSFDYCFDKAKGSSGSWAVEKITSCIEQLGGNDFPLEYVKACEKTFEKRFGGIESSSIRLCLKYLANNNASFDSEAFALCFRANDYNLKDAKSCFNAIRDRDVDAQKLERECFKNGKADSNSATCIEKLTDTMPSLAACKSGRNSSGSSDAKFKGVH